MKESYCLRYAFAFLCLYSTTISGWLCDRTIAQGDPVEVIWQEYEADPNKSRSLHDWSERILKVVEKNPNSSLCANVLVNLSGACNSREEYELSLILLEKSLEYKQSQFSRMQTLGFIGAVAKEQYQKLVDTNDSQQRRQYAERMLKSYDQFEEEFSALKLDDGNEANWFRLSQLMVIYYRSESEIYCEEFENTRKALEKIEQAIHLIQDRPNLLGSGVLAGNCNLYWSFLRDKATILLRSGDVDKTCETLIEIGQQPQIEEQRYSDLIYGFVGRLFPEKGEAYRNFLTRYVTEVPADIGTPRLLLDVAQSFAREEKYEEAIKVYTTIHNDWKKEVEQLDKVASENGAGGVTSFVLAGLINAYQKLQMPQKAEVYMQEMQSLRPQDAMIEQLQVQQQNTIKKIEEAQVIGKLPRRRRLTSVLVLLVINIIAFVFFFRRYIRLHSS